MRILLNILFGPCGINQDRFTPPSRYVSATSNRSSWAFYWSHFFVMAVKSSITDHLIPDFKSCCSNFNWSPNSGILHFIKILNSTFFIKSVKIKYYYFRNSHLFWFLVVNVIGFLLHTHFAPFLCAKWVFRSEVCIRKI